ncbi:Mysoin-binding motif of peroxisomes-domain-containing protein [Plectosphaerella cucumerina]|uniref:Vezatin n=1 Tax=Plectosphaerella cucumerina TaxID=40658 RepID=A0A8K0X914_9PEZI|nr:Mysoin-binding motif of peroxisomes-domain-containing protein [Plectosphaerella cucumerina]
MEPVVFDRSPLADYLRDEGQDGEAADWAPADSLEQDHTITPPLSPVFAPTGRPMVRSRFRGKAPEPLKVDIPNSSLNPFRRSYSTAVASRIDRAGSSKFLEQFRYTIVASQLLSGHTIAGSNAAQSRPPPGDGQNQNGNPLLDPTGAIGTVLGALAFALAISWMQGAGGSGFTKRRIAVLVILTAITAGVIQVFMRRQWLRYRRHQALSEVSDFVSHTQDFDSATAAAISLIQEVELVSRGYRLSAPLPPISRLEDRAQTRRCVRLRKALRMCFSEVLRGYEQTRDVVQGFSEQLDLEKYYDIYDISDLDMVDARQGLAELDAEDAESLRTLKISAARFHIVRKMFLCSLLALDANGDNNDLLRWTTTVEALRTLNTATASSCERLKNILSEQETFPTPPTPRIPLTPGRERWRGQLRKLNGLSTGIRGLQAKLQLLREESDRSLDESDDISELGSNLLLQYDSIGIDLRALMQSWEEGRAALATGIDRNERRISSMSTLLSPASSISGPTAVDEVIGGTASDALKALNGELDISSNGDSDEVFEAVAMPRPRSLLTREERIAKMKEDREKREVARDRSEANKGMLRELEMVINLRPRPRTMTTPSRTATSRIVSM